MTRPSTSTQKETSTMPQTRALPVVHFRRNGENYGEPRYVLAKDEGDALVILRGLDAFFGNDPSARYGYDVLVPEHFLEKHPLQIDSQDEHDLDAAVDYDRDNPEHVAWMAEARALLTD